MPFDLRMPLGLLLLAYGALLSVYGFLHGDTRYEHSLGLNADLIWGLALLMAGGAFAIAARRSRRRQLKRQSAG